MQLANRLVSQLGVHQDYLCATVATNWAVSFDAKCTRRRCLPRFHFFFRRRQTQRGADGSSLFNFVLKRSLWSRKRTEMITDESGSGPRADKDARRQTLDGR